jgi:hypothetical protein
LGSGGDGCRHVGRRSRLAIDDRGQRIPLQWTRAIPIGSLLGRRFDIDFKRAVARRPRWGRVSTLRVIVIMMFAVLAVWILELSLWGVPIVVMSIVIPVCVACVMLDGSHCLVVEELLERGMCGACRYDLDGCVLCPECGAAWRIPLSESVRAAEAKDPPPEEV